MRYLQTVLSVFYALFMFDSASAHGVQHHIWEGGVGVEVHHEVQVDGADEIPLANAEVQIYSPAHMDQPFQTGNTDIHGIFMFRPDTIGLWTLKFLDESGHGKVVEVMVDELNAVELATDHQHSSWRDIVSGLGLIFLIFGLWIVLKKKK